jgi:hypothetical protein
MQVTTEHRQLLSDNASHTQTTPVTVRQCELHSNNASYYPTMRVTLKQRQLLSDNASYTHTTPVTIQQCELQSSNASYCPTMRVTLKQRQLLSNNASYSQTTPVTVRQCELLSYNASYYPTMRVTVNDLETMRVRLHGTVTHLGAGLCTASWVSSVPSAQFPGGWVLGCWCGPAKPSGRVGGVKVVGEGGRYGSSPLETREMKSIMEGKESKH